MPKRTIFTAFLVVAVLLPIQSGCRKTTSYGVPVSSFGSPRALRVILLPVPETPPPFFWEGLNSLTNDWQPDVLILSGRVPPNLKSLYEESIRDFAADSPLQYITIDWTRFLPEDIDSNQTIADDKEYYERRFLVALSRFEPLEVKKPLKQIVRGRERTSYFGEPALFPFLGLRFDLQKERGWPTNRTMLWGVHLPEAGALDRETGHLPRVIGEVNAADGAGMVALDIKRPPTDPALKLLTLGWKDAWSLGDENDGLGFTFPAPVPKQRLSYYFLTDPKALSVPRMYPIAMPLGAHYPLFAELLPAEY